MSVPGYLYTSKTLTAGSFPTFMQRNLSAQIEKYKYEHLITEMEQKQTTTVTNNLQ